MVEDKVYNLVAFNSIGFFLIGVQNFPCTAQLDYGYIIKKVVQEDKIQIRFLQATVYLADLTAVGLSRLLFPEGRYMRGLYFLLLSVVLTAGLFRWSGQAVLV